MTFLEIMEKAGVDMDETLRRFGGNSALMERFMRRFPDDPTFAELYAAYEVWLQNPLGGLDDIARATHTLKGTSGNLGLTPLYNCCSAVVEACREASRDTGNTYSIDKLPSLLDGLFQEYATVIALLGQLD